MERLTASECDLVLKLIEAATIRGSMIDEVYSLKVKVLRLRDHGEADVKDFEGPTGPSTGGCNV